MVIMSSLGYCRTALQGTRHCVELPFPWATLPQMQKGFCYLCDLPVSGVLRCYLHSMWYSNFIYSLKYSVKANIPWPVFLNFRHCSFWSLQEDADTSVTEDSILGAWSRHSDSDTWAFIMYCGMASGWKMAREYHLLQCCLSIGCLCSLLPHLLTKLPKCWIVGRWSSLAISLVGMIALQKCKIKFGTIIRKRNSAQWYYVQACGQKTKLMNFQGH